MIPEELLSAIKNYLDITWDDPAGDTKLAGIALRGMNYINSMAGAELDYDAEDLPRALLFDYCRYVRSNAHEEYIDNFLGEILALQMRMMPGIEDE